MNRIIAVISLSFLFLNIQAQIANDSLLLFWNNTEIPINLRCDALVKLGNKYWDIEPDKCLELFNDGQGIALKNGLEEYQGRFLVGAAICCMIKDDIPMVHQLLDSASQIFDRLNSQKSKILLLSAYGNLYSYLDNFPMAISYIEQSINLKEQIGDSTNDLQSDYTMLAYIHYTLKNYPKYLEYSKLSLLESQKSDNKERICEGMLTVSYAYIMLKNLEMADKYLLDGQNLSKEIKYYSGIAKSLTYQGEVANLRGDFKQAEELFKQSQIIREQYGINAEKSWSLLKAGENFNSLKKHNEASKYCYEALVFSREHNEKVGQRGALECLYQAHKAVGEKGLALKYFEELSALNEEINSDEAIRKLQQMDFDKQIYQDSMANVEADRLVQEAHEEEVRSKNRTRNILAGGGLIVLLLAGGLYSRNRYIKKSKDIIEGERDRSDNLLLNILPEEIAKELKEKGKADARDFDMVSILFTDFKHFTQTSEKLTAAELVNEINHCFEAFDSIMEKYGVEKIKTIGDAYMAAGGLPVPTDDSVKNTVLAALEMQAFITNRKSENDALNKAAFEMRVGIHTGPVVAGIVGVKKFQYDIWGDTVNTASRMESAGEVGKVNISQATYDLIKSKSETKHRPTERSRSRKHSEEGFEFESRGKIEAKGKGEIEMYFVRRSPTPKL